MAHIMHRTISRIGANNEVNAPIIPVASKTHAIMRAALCGIPAWIAVWVKRSATREKNIAKPERYAKFLTELLMLSERGWFRAVGVHFIPDGHLKTWAHMTDAVICEK